jgi:micrococcal nuclease
VVHRAQFRPRRPIAKGVAVVLAALVGVRIWQLASDGRPERIDAGAYYVESITDGDTIRLANGAPVRLIGIDTPETSASPRSGGIDQPLAAKATAFTADKVQGRMVRLQFDKERIDKYGRFLAYVWYVDREAGHELLLNEELVRAGLARARLGYSYSERMKRRFRAAESEAREARRGTWATDQSELQNTRGWFSTRLVIARIGHLAFAPLLSALAHLH